MNENLTYEEIKEILKKAKNHVDRYIAAYDELMKLGRKACQLDLRYYSLYRQLLNVFSPDSYNNLGDIKNDEMYFNLLLKCANNYHTMEHYYQLMKCYAYGVGTKINDTNLTKYTKLFFNTAFNSNYLREPKCGTIEVFGEEIPVRILYDCLDRICLDKSTTNEFIIHSYRPLSLIEFKFMCGDFVMARGKALSEQKVEQG